MFYSDFFWGMLGYFIGYLIWYSNQCESKPYPPLGFGEKDVTILIFVTLTMFLSNAAPVAWDAITIEDVESKNSVVVESAETICIEEY